MWIVVVLCLLGIAFLVLCLQGFRKAGNRPYNLHIVYTTEEKRSFAAPRKARLIIFPRRAEKVHVQDAPQNRGVSSL